MCITPINLKKETFKQKLNDTYHMQQVPCGRCIECRKLRVNSWFVRLNNELDNASSAYFITLTYNDDNLPYSDNGLCTLDYRDVQLFNKRVRKRDGNERYKYFFVGEYGEQTHRPHYHALIFNISDVDLVGKIWDKGQIHVGKVQEASIYYTLKYALKRSLRWNKTDPLDDRNPEKALMSRGLGAKFLTDEMVKYYKDDVSRPVTMLGNKKLGLPRYYRDKIFTNGEKLARNRLLQPHNEKRLEKTYDPIYPQRVQKMYSDHEKKFKKTD